MTSEADLPIEPDEESGERLDGPLPDAVRTRVIALAADAIGALAREQLPPSLKRVAAFAPARRAKLAGNQIAGVLETDPDFRERLGRQVRALKPELALAMESGAAPAAADPTEMAAVAYLTRPTGWTHLVEKAAEVVGAERAQATGRQTEEQVERLRQQVEANATELRNARERSREQIATLKAENAELRRKLGDARVRARSSEESAENARAETERVTAAASVAATAADAELRRLRSRVEELERELSAARRSDRSARDEGTLRARLLLDTLLDSAQGLRRELGLPAVEGSPADAVEAHIADAGSETSTRARSLSTESPALLLELLSLPRAHLIVDGYNVTKTAWPDASLEVQRDRLLGGLAPLIARLGIEVTVVFDAADKSHRPVVKAPRGVRVLFSPLGVIADDVIRDLVAAEPAGRPVIVVSSDRQVGQDVSRAGARSVAAVALTGLLGR